jgi:WD40 repeat protein
MVTSPKGVRPYVGLRPYTEGDAPFFYGRDRERKLIVANLLASRLTVLYGPSGVGKSSVLDAGVRHDVRTRQGQDGVPPLSVVMFSSWKDEPLEALAAAIRAELGGGDASATVNGRSTERLDRTLHEATAPSGGVLLLIFDQFEEFFLYHGAEDGSGTFAVEFPRAVRSPNLRVRFLVSIREDALAQLDFFKGRIPRLFENRLRMEYLKRDAARQAVVGPIAEYNRLAAGQEPITVEPGLVEALLEEVQTGRVVLSQDEEPAGSRTVWPRAPSDDRIETPFLQLVMERLWDEEVKLGSRQLRLSTLSDRLGGAGTIIRSYLDDSLANMSEGERDIAAETFRYLVSPSGTKIAQFAEDLVKLVGEDAHAAPTEVPSVLAELAKLRVLRTVAPPLDRPGAQRYEIFHDILAAPILDWRARHLRARREAEEEQKRLLAKREAEAEIRRTRALAEARRRAAWWARLVAVLLAVFLAVSTVLTVWAIGKARQARSGELAAQSLNALGTDPLGSIVLARRAVDAKATPGAVEALRRAIVGSAARAQMSIAPARVSAVAFSADGRSVVAGDDRGNVSLWEWAARREPMVLNAGGRSVTSVGFSRDGSRLLAVSHDAGTVTVWPFPAGRPPVRLRTDGGPDSAAFSPDSRYVVTATDVGWIQVWDTLRAQGPRQLAATRIGGGAFAAAFAGGNDRVVAIGSQGKAEVWSWPEGAAPIRLPGDGGQVLSAGFSSDGRYAAAGGNDGRAQVWDVARGGRPRILRTAGPVDDLEFNSDGSLFLTVDTPGGRVQVWRAATGTAARPPLKPGPGVRVAHFSPDPEGRSLITGSADGSAAVWSRLDGGRVGLRGHTEGIRAVAFDPSGSHVVTGSGDGTVRVWRWNRDSPPIPFPRPMTWAAISPTRAFIAAVTEQGFLRVWRVQDGRQLAALDLGEAVDSMGFAGDGTIVAGTDTGLVHIWDWQRPGRPPPPQSVASAPIKSVALTPHRDELVAATSDRTFLVPLGGLASRRVLPGGLGMLSHNGRSVLTASRDGSVVIWAANGGARLAGLPGAPTSPVTSATFSPDDRLVALGAGDSMRVWEWGAGGTPRTLELPGHTSVRRVAFSRDGSKLLVEVAPEPGSRAGFQTLVWQRQRGSWRLQVELDGYRARISPDGNFVFTQASDGLAAWDVSTGRLAHHFDRPRTILLAVFTQDGQSVVTVRPDGAQVYSCDVCVPLDRLRRLAAERVPAVVRQPNREGTASG